MLNDVPTINDVEVSGKIVLVRVDLNSSIGEDGKIQPNARFTAHVATVKELVKKNAKVVIIAHQGRPGDKEFRSLAEHAAILSSASGVEVKFVPDVFGPTALQRIKSLLPGEAILLDNVRLLSEEMLERSGGEAAKSLHVEKLANCADLFVNDAFSVSHRSNASVVGFPVLLPSIAGRAMERELAACQRLLEYGNAVFLLGGVKFKEAMHLAQALCKNGKAKKVLTCGAFSLLFLKAKSIALGEKTEEKLEALATGEFLPAAKQLLNSFPDVVATPIDVALDFEGKRKEYGVLDLPVNKLILDLGQKTVANYAGIVKNAEVVFAKGAPGEFEKREFSLSSRELGKALTEAKGFTVLGGGSWSTIFNQFKLDEKKISHVSLSGGALLDFLSGNKLPGIEALRQKR